jgi:O-antigen/teichoic acid export membrane protein
MWWFFPILLLEYINQELFRLLTVSSRQFTASIILLVRQGSWAVAVVLIMAFMPSSRELGLLMALWTCAGLVAAGIGIFILLSTGIQGWGLPIDWQWVKNGIGVSAAFLTATFALRGFQTVDRYWLQALGGIEIVAAYVLFIGVAGTLLTLLDASVFAYTYPALIAHHQHEEHDEARKKMRNMFILTALGCAAFSLVSCTLMPWLVEWTVNPVYRNALPLYPWILSATVLNALGMVPHYGLYACGRDRPIIRSHIAALPAFALSVWLLSGRYNVLAVPIGLNISFALILLWKTAAYWQANPDLGPNLPSSQQ